MLSRTQQDVLSTLCYLGMPFSEAHQAVSEGAAGRKGESFDELLEAVPERPATRGESRCLVPALRPKPGISGPSGIQDQIPVALGRRSGDFQWQNRRFGLEQLEEVPDDVSHGLIVQHVPVSKESNERGKRSQRKTLD